MMAPEMRSPDGNRATQEHGSADNQIIADDGHERKEFAGLQAKAALAGYSVHSIPDGSYLVCRWDFSRAVPDLRTLKGFLRRLGVPA